MPISNRSRSSELAGLEPRSVSARVLRVQTDIATRIGDAAWSALHVMGAHRWRDAGTGQAADFVSSLLVLLDHIRE